MYLKGFNAALLLGLFLNFNTWAFTGSECLNSTAVATVVHKGSPFGLTENVLTLNKQACLITIEQEKLKFLKKKWDIDVCRAPVHIKYGTGAVEILRMTENCNKDSNETYCQEKENLFEIIQDDGLIFAAGEKEDLKSDHGKINCAYVLLKAYLEKGTIFSKGQEFADVVQSRDMNQVPPSAVEKEQAAPANNGSQVYDF